MYTPPLRRGESCDSTQFHTDQIGALARRIQQDARPARTKPFVAVGLQDYLYSVPLLQIEDKHAHH